MTKILNVLLAGMIITLVGCGCHKRNAFQSTRLTTQHRTVSQQ